MKPRFKRTTEDIMVAYSLAQREYTNRRDSCAHAILSCREAGHCNFPECIRDPETGRNLPLEDCGDCKDVCEKATAAWSAKKARANARTAVLNRAHAIASAATTREVVE